MAASLNIYSRFLFQPIRLGIKRCPCLHRAVQQMYLIRHLTDSPPSMPKRPGAPYSFYVKDHFPKMQESHPGESPQSLMKKLADKWKELHEDEKQTYKICFMEAMQRYKETKEEFESYLGDDELRKLKKEKENISTKKKEAKARRELQSELEHAGMPKYPTNAYALFATHAKKSIEGTTHFLKAVGEAWKNLSEEEKAHYVSTARERREDYKVQLEIWKQKMYSEGRSDLVLKSSRTGKKK